MARVFISFLGTNDYLPCIYFRDGFQAENVRFVQEAVVRLCCGKWASDDRILIFTTEGARVKNWEDNGHLDRATGEPLKRVGLNRCLTGLGLPPALQRVSIPEGKSEEEIWDIFSLVFDELKHEDHVIFDITHAFRSIPMLAIVVLNYAKVMKDVTLQGIYYGAFEVLGSIAEAKKIPLEKRLVPILDLTSFDQLMGWSTAIDRFIGAGDTRLISRLAGENTRPILKETKGMDESAGRIRTMARALSDFTGALATCRGPEISSAGLHLKNVVSGCLEVDLIRPLQPLFGRVMGQVASFRGDIIHDGIQAVKWCLGHNLVQQGVTILNELVLTWAVTSIAKDPLDVDTRNVASQALAIVIKKKKDNEDEWKPLARKRRDVTRSLIEVFEARGEMVKAANSLGQLRNDINHAGFGSGAIRAKRACIFSRRLEKVLATIEESMLTETDQGLSQPS